MKTVKFSKVDPSRQKKIAVEQKSGLVTNFTQKQNHLPLCSVAYPIKFHNILKYFFLSVIF